MPNQTIPVRGMRVTGSVRFVPGQYDFSESDGLIIDSDYVVIDGGGAELCGGCAPECGQTEGNHEEFGYGEAANPNNGRQLGFCGVGLRIEGRKHVIIMNLKLKGFDIGALLQDCEHVSLINCDFTGCFHDPAWGWDDHGDHGAILMVNSNRCEIAGCRANNVWDALSMRHSNECSIYDCDFSHTSDTGLKLWHSCRNNVVNCDFSYGIRIDPGEVHARDSASVLIESGSDWNWFYGNDMSHGGDGLFIRVLNGWMSCHNTFVNNDCSYANNNAIEAWADHNTYIGNKANYSSYGFWLGNSDYIHMEDNEIAFNGDPAHHNNAPEAFGNAGVSIVNGSGSHSVIRNNYIHDNFGPGIALRNSPANPSRHWLLQGNRLENNHSIGRYRGHGIYLKHARLVTLADNVFVGNEGEEVCRDKNVADVQTLTGVALSEQPIAVIHAKWDGDHPRAGTSIAFTCGSDPQTVWDFGDECTALGSSTMHVYAKPGMYQVSATINGVGGLALGGMTLHVLPEDFRAVQPIGECDGAQLSSAPGVYGNSAIVADSTEGSEHLLRLRLPQTVETADGDALLIQLQHFSDAPTDWGKESRYPVITLHGAQGGTLTLTPQEPLLEMYYAPRSEMRGTGRVYTLPLTGGAGMKAETQGDGLAGGVQQIDIRYGGMGDAHSRLVLNALGFCSAPQPAPHWYDITLDARAEWEGVTIRGEAQAVLGVQEMLWGDITPRITFEGDGALAAVFAVPRMADRVECMFYENCAPTDNAHGETLPESCTLEIRVDGKWQAVSCGKVAPVVNAPTVFEFAPTKCEAVRVRFAGGASIARLAAYHSRAITGVQAQTQPGTERVDAVWLKLNKEINANGSPLGALTVNVFDLDESGALRDCLFAAQVPADEVVPYQPLRVATPGLTLAEGERYAVALGQTERARSRTEGDYYRWISGHGGYSDCYGIYTGGETRPTDYDWGTNWLRVVAGEASTNLTHNSDLIGVRFGIEGMECRYQTFVAPSQCDLLTDGCLSGDGYRLTNEVSLILPGRTQISVVDIYAPERCACNLVLFNEQGEELARVLELQCGCNRITIRALTKCIRLTTDSPLNITEIELVGL